jgi:putative hydrolase of the HAD superfamily
MKKLVNQYDLEKYFVNMHFSADYKIRKPHKDIFQIVYNEIKNNDDSIELEQIYFVGDNFEADTLGAKSFGFTPVFINRKQDTGINMENCIEIKSLNELLEVIS